MGSESREYEDEGLTKHIMSEIGDCYSHTTIELSDCC